MTRVTLEMITDSPYHDDDACTNSIKNEISRFYSICGLFESNQVISRSRSSKIERSTFVTNRAAMAFKKRGKEQYNTAKKQHVDTLVFFLKDSGNIDVNEFCAVVKAAAVCQTAVYHEHRITIGVARVASVKYF